MCCIDLADAGLTGRAEEVATDTKRRTSGIRSCNLAG
jgi:hypothetical protein